MGHVAIYARQSVDRDDRRISVSAQLQRCHALAADAFPALPTADYTDAGISGATTERHGYQALLADLRAGRVEALICHEQSRLTRDPAEWERLQVALGEGVGKLVLAHPAGGEMLTKGLGDCLVDLVL